MITIRISIFFSVIFLLAISIPTIGAETESPKSELSVNTGKLLFEGSQKFTNGGPSCISCHSIKYNKVIPGGKYGVDLTDAYQKYSVGLSAWLANPNITAMEASFQNHPLTEKERDDLSAFLQFVMENKNSQSSVSGDAIMLFGGFGGLCVILILVGFIWNKRKKNMVKEQIFMRQIKAADAKF